MKKYLVMESVSDATPEALRLRVGRSRPVKARLVGDVLCEGRPHASSRVIPLASKCPVARTINVWRC
ncbi:hypothetical protein KGM_210141 [Danaus plexippus plexippus]|uniref:Uncharacterized protein n=1 Tax=Danaus plexippus plexippus TaxID=278856 RepID=A0A212EGZ7_DANPL|nr:hypothetical protein KGM_210141 [Danaus plexippus plexippus]